MPDSEVQRPVVRRRRIAGREMKPITVNIGSELYGKLCAMKGDLSNGAAIEILIESEHQRSLKRAEKAIASVREKPLGRDGVACHIQVNR